MASDLRFCLLFKSALRTGMPRSFVRARVLGRERDSLRERVRVRSRGPWQALTLFWNGFSTTYVIFVLAQIK